MQTSILYICLMTVDLCYHVNVILPRKVLIDPLCGMRNVEAIFSLKVIKLFDFQKDMHCITLGTRVTSGK